MSQKKQTTRKTTGGHPPRLFPSSTSTTTSSLSPPELPRIAVLDDYHHFAPTFLSRLCAPPGSSSPTLPVDFTVFDNTILPTTPEGIDALVARLEPYTVLVTMRERTPLRRVVLERLPNLEIILTTGMRNLGIDMDACKELGITVTGTPNATTKPGAPSDFNATVQHTFALLFGIVNNIPRDHALLASGSWLRASPLNTFIGGQTLGIIGLGKLGTGVARIAHVAFGMKIVAWSENLTQEKADAAGAASGLQPGTFKAVSKDELFKVSDIVSVHVVLSDRTRDLITKVDLEKMKPSSFLVNTARGPIVNEGDLLEVLEKGKIRGAALDVFDAEPLPLDSKWRTTKWGEGGRSEVVFTPHAGYSYGEHMEWMWENTVVNLQALIDGKDVQWELK